MNKYLFELYDFEGKPIKDTVEANNLREAFNLIDGEFGTEIFKDLHIELLRKDIE